jgi:predicted nucleotidyltransferase
MTREEAIAEITRRLVEDCQPVRVYLFGSEARGDAGPDSDLDFLVVVPDDASEDLFRAGRLRRAIRGLGQAVDVIPWRRSDFEGRAAYVVASLPATVVREGRLLYDAERVAA